MMDDYDFYFYSILFKNKIYELSGQGFEDFFIKIFLKHDSEFQTVKAYGKLGDRKNDGFNRKKGIYYQIYAPEVLAKSIYNAKSKLKFDFKGLLEEWDNKWSIIFFFFVINDKFQGIPTPIYDTLSILEKENEQVNFDILDSEKIKKIFFSLSKQDIIDLVGLIPYEELLYNNINMSALIDVINHLIKKPNNLSSLSKPIAPNFKEKIVFNNLNEKIESLLVTASLQVGNIENYFESNPSHRSILQKKFKELYDEAKNKFADENDMFVSILQNSIPDVNSLNQNATLVLMSYYFETCDIFETPIKIKK